MQGDIDYATTIGWPVYTFDGERIGEVGEVRGRYFKVNAPMQPDYWLSTDLVQAAGNRRLTLLIDRNQLETQMLERPETEAIAGGTDAVQLLRGDHRRVQALFRQYERLDGNADQRRNLARQVFTELDVHTKLEEEIFYPAVKDAEDRQGQELIDKSFQEHHVVDVLINELKRMDPGDGQFDPKFRVLIENVDHHIQEEEDETFPDAESRLGGELKHLGEEMATRKQQLLAATRER